MSLQKCARWAICAVITCALLYFFPLVRMRKLGSAPTTSVASPTQADSQSSGSATSATDVTVFIESLWKERLPKAVGSAAQVDEVLALAASDANRARQTFGRQVGLGGPTFFFLRGRGQIESVDDDECRIIIDGVSQCVVLEIGILVSNAVRDATGLVDVDDFPNSQDFNRLSSELNSRCESEVIRPVRDQLIVGTIVEFVGCGEVRDNDEFDPLKLIPVQLKTVTSRESPE